MKKILTLFTVSLFILSCSSEDSSSNSGSNGNTIRSYKFNSQAGTEHFFENNGSRYEKIVANNKLQTKYFYDSNNRMTKIETYETDGITVYQTISYFYNSNNKINKIEVKSGNSTDTWLFTRNGNIVTGEMDWNTSDPNDFNEQRVRYTFNNDNLLVKYENYSVNEEHGTTNMYAYSTFTYDANKNPIKLKKSAGGVHDIPGGDTPTYTDEYNFHYDDKINPLFNVFQNHYENYILIQTNSFDFDFPSGTVFRSYAKNNITITDYPSDYLFGKYKYQYNYQSNNLPASYKLILTQNGSTAQSVTYNYQ